MKSNKTINKGHVQEKLLGNLRKEINQCFNKYRLFVSSNKNEGLRTKFYNILRKEIMDSLNTPEKVNLLEEIHRDIYHYSPDITDTLSQSYSTNCSDNFNGNESTHSVYQTNDPCIDILSKMCYNDYSKYSSTKEITNTQYQNDIYDNGNSFGTYNADMDDTRYSNETFLCRGVISSADKQENKNSSKNSHECSNQTSIENQNDEEDLKLIENLFNELTIHVENGEDIVERLENLKVNHGPDIYQRTITHIPRNESQDLPKKEPIMFQLVSKIDQYEEALDKLLIDDLLKLNQRNQYHVSILNFLLFKDFELLYKFLSYLNKKKIENIISYIYLKSDWLENKILQNDNKISETSTNKNKTNGNSSIQPLSTYNSAEKMLMRKGIVYYRTMLKEPIKRNFNALGKNELFDHLKSSEILTFVLNEPIENEGTYIDELVNNYPESQSEIKLIMEKDQNAILSSSFLFLLAKRNIKMFYKNLLFLCKDLKIDRKVLSQACQKENEDGKTVMSVIQENSDKMYERPKNYMLEFFKQY